MKKDTIYVLHEYGAPSHYNSLVELGKQNGFEVKFRIFNFKSIIKNIINGHFLCAFESITFLLSLPFIGRKKIVLGIAPFNKLLYPLSILLNRHSIYYHSSYTCWDGKIMAHPTKSKYVIEFWKRFIQQKVSHVFAVSQKTATELIKNKFVTEDRISIVNHSYTPTIPILKHTKDNTFIYVGRLVNSKGIPELLEIFSKHPNARLIVIGQGELEASVIDYSKRYQNIIYKGYIKGLDQIIPYYRQSSFILLNSQKTGTWEELFGIAIIEGMANGCVPLTTNHPGPIEIISHNINGFIVKEKEIGTIIDYAIGMDDSTYQCLRKKAIETGQSYHCSNMASRWTKILNSPI